MTGEQRVQPLASMQEVRDAIVQMEQQAPGEWYVWGDEVNPVMENVDYDTMKKAVDEDTTDKLYGENTKTNDIYEGIQ